MKLINQLRNKLHKVQKEMKEIEGPIGHVPSCMRYEYKKLIEKSARIRRSIELLYEHELVEVE